MLNVLVTFSGFMVKSSGRFGLGPILTWRMYIRASIVSVHISIVAKFNVAMHLVVLIVIESVPKAGGN